MKTFVLRVEVDETGTVIGVVERVRTGEKERFQGYEMLGEVIRRMVATEGALPTILRSPLRSCDGPPATTDP